MNQPLNHIISEIRDILNNARSVAYYKINRLTVLTNFEIGRIIFTNEQKGNNRAPYGKETLKLLSSELTAEFGKGFSVDNLQLMRSFFLEYNDRILEQGSTNYETLSRKLEIMQKDEKPADLIKQPYILEFLGLKIRKLTHGDIGQKQMYVNYFDRTVKLPDENPTVGIILCKQNNKTVVEFTLPEDQDQIFSRE
jgi:predicted nuclease of restriction endonuclease-like (RecB) superfamily